jgi:hypothetical protein
MDEVTMKVMLCFCKIVYIIDENISCKHCFFDTYIAYSCYNVKIVNNLIVNFGNKMFCPSIFKEDVMHTCVMNG